METKQLFHFIVTKAENDFTFIMSNSASWGNAIDAAYEMYQNITNMAQKAMEANAPAVAPVAPVAPASSDVTPDVMA